MSKSDVLMVSKQPPTYVMVPSRTVQADLVTENKIVVYVPIATRDVYGTVKIGDGINIENGTISFDESKVTILSISKNGTNIVPDENKHVNIELSKIDVGLANVDNTSDMYKPISVYQQEALDEKVDVYQGEVNVGKALVVDVYGNVSLQEVSMSLDEDVLSDIAVEIKDDNFNIVKTHLNLKTLAENKQAMNLPLANDTQSGLMSVADYVSIRNLQDRVGRLEFKTTRLLYTDTLYPTPEQIDEFAVSVGYTAPFDGVSIIVDGTNHVWHYYENDIGWKDDGLDVVGQFTNDIAGVIRGSVADGKIYAETDGTGSVYGWDDLKNKVSDLETASKNYVTYTDYATASKAGLIRANSSQGLFINATGDLSLVQAQSTDLVNKTNKFRPLTANNMDEALKVSMTTNTQEWSDDDKTSARNLINAVGAEEYATLSKAGVVRASQAHGTDILHGDILAIRPATNAMILAKEKQYHPITPSTLDYAVKVGVTTNTNALTDEEKTNAQNWLGVDDYVKKITDSGVRAYVSVNGTQGSRVLTDGAVANTIVQRSTTGTFKATTPTADLDVTNKQYVDGIAKELQDRIDGISIEGTGTSVTVDGSPQTAWESNVKVDKRLSGLFGTTVVENDGNKAGLRWENDEKDYRSFATSALGLTYSEENSQGESALLINTESGFGYSKNNSDRTKTDRFTINSEGFNYTSEDSTTGFGAAVLVSPSALGMIGMSASGIQGVQFMDNKAQIMASSGVYINGEENSNKVATLGDLPSVNVDDKVDKQVSSHGYVATIDMLDTGGQVTISCESNDGYGALDILPTEIVSSVPIYVNGEKTATVSELPTKTSDLTNDSGFATTSYVDNSVKNDETTITQLGVTSGTSTITIGNIEQYKKIYIMNYRSSQWRGFFNVPTAWIKSHYGEQIAIESFDGSRMRVQFNNATSFQVVASYYVDDIYVFGCK